MSDLVWTPVKIKLGQIRQWKNNPRYSTKKDAANLVKSLKDFGQPEAFSVSPFDGNMVDLYNGHQRTLSWMASKGADFEVWAMQSNRPLTEREKEKLTIFLHTGAVGRWNWDALSGWSAADLREWGMDDETLRGWNSDANNLKEMLGAEDEGQQKEHRETLAERFGVPPFSVLDARQGYWQNRKRAWIDLGIQSELGRGDSPSTSARSDEPSYRTIRRHLSAAPGGSLRDAMTLENGHTVRGDGKGRKFAGALKDSEEYPDTLASKRMYDKKDNSLLGNSKQARSHYKEAATSYSSQQRLTALQKTGSSAVDYGTAGNASEQTGTSIFDPVLCEIAYRWFMPIGAGKIIDPFAGGSVRGVVASLLGKQYTGVDLSSRQIEANEQQGRDLCKENHPRWINGDSAQIKHLAGGEYDFIFSCPPYADLEVYSDNPADLSRMEYTDFLGVYREIIAQCVSMLKDNRFACFVVGDVRDEKGFYRNFPAATISAFQDAGMILYNEAVLITAIGSLPIRVGRQFDKYRKLGKTHQNVLVFYKGNPKAIKDFGAVEFGELEGADEIPN